MALKGVCSRWCERVFGSSRGLESVLGPEKRGVSIWQQISRRGGVGSARTVICEASESGDLGTGTGVITPGVPDTMLMTGGESRTDKLWRVYSKWTTPFVRYSISCSISNVLYFVVYLLLLRVIPSAGVAVTIAYLASVTWQHALHRILVYGKGLNISSAYFRELAGIYMAYSVAFILNPIITEGVIKAGEAHILRTGDVALQHYLKPLGFAASLVLTGILNFFTVTAVFEATAGAENQQRIAEKEKAFKE